MNPIAIDLGIVKIYWYSILLVIAFIIGCLLLYKEAKKFNIPENFITNMLVGLIPITLIGARLYFCLFHFDFYSNHLLQIFAVWKGGLAIHGGIIAGIIWIFLYTRKYKFNTLLVLDFMTISLIIGQAIGRWGNFFNGEAYGPETTYEYLKTSHLPEFIIKGMYIEGAYYIPAFLYESILCICGFAILLIIRRAFKIRVGTLTGIYLIWYGITRFFIESLRDFDYLKLGNFRVAQIVSVLMIASGIVLLAITYTRQKKDLYNERGIKNV